MDYEKVITAIFIYLVYTTIPMFTFIILHCACEWSVLSAMIAGVLFIIGTLIVLFYNDFMWVIENE